MEPWTETATARERVESVALTLRQPRSVNWIKEQAEVGSWETTKSHLDHLVEMGRLRAVERDGHTRYAPDRMREYLDHVRDLVVENTKEELRDELETIAAETEDWKDTHGVDSRSELEASLGDPDLAPPEIRERRKVLTYWEENDQYRRSITHALRLYDDLRAVDEDASPARA
ncbi:MAG: hypothetical protein ABEH66_04565 [Halobacteriales archaeon]